MLKHIIGSVLSPAREGPVVVVHCNNDAGKWGAGVSGVISRHWPITESEYRRWHRNGHDKLGGAFKLGHVQFVKVEEGIHVANLIGQHDVYNDRDGNPPVRYSAIKHGLNKVASFAKLQGASVHAPRLGAALAGGDWARIEEIIISELCDAGVDVTIYTLKSEVGKFPKVAYENMHEV